MELRRRVAATLQRILPSARPTTPRPEAAGPPSSAEQSLAEQVRLVFQGTLGASAAVVVVSAAATVLVWGPGREARLAGWLALMILTPLLRVAVLQLYRRAAPPAQTARRWAAAFTVVTAGVGVAWSLAAFWVMPVLPRDEQIVIIVMLTGTMAAGVPVLSPLLPAAYVYIGPPLVGLLFQLFAGDAAIPGGVGAIVAMFSVLLLVITSKVHRIIVGGIRLRFENEHLARDVGAAKTRAEAAGVAKSQFLATMSHELRTPMFGILGGCEVLMKDVEDPAHQEQLLMLQESGEHMLGLLDRILEVADAGARRDPMHLAPVAVDPLLERAVAAVAPTARDRGLQIGHSAAPGMPAALMLDAPKLSRALGHLLQNAVKYTDAGGVRVDAQTEPIADGRLTLRIHVVDTGPGIDEKDRERIFETFTQVDGSYARRYGGVGLGLALANDLVASMQGALRVESTPGAGTRFTIELTVTASEVAGDPAARDGAEAVRLDGVRVLVVEDNRVNQKLARRFLEDAGCAVDVASNGVEAVDAHAGGRYDLILMDCQMPVLDGFDATRAIRVSEEACGKRTPIVALTANTLPSDRERCRAAGMDDFVGKPVRAKQLVAKLGIWVEPRAAHGGDSTTRRSG